MKNLIIAIGCSILLATMILADDEVKKDSKTNSKVSESKTEAKDYEVSGVLTSKKIRTNKSAGFMYVIQTSDKEMVGFNPKIGDKEINLTQLENKQVVVKGQNIETKEFEFDLGNGESKDFNITYINKLSSIELKDETKNSKKAEEK